MIGKVIAVVLTVSMCAQPVGQMVYGVLFDRFSAAPYWVLLPSGIFVCVIGLMSSGFFQGLDDR